VLSVLSSVNWTTVIWSMMATACLILAGIHFTLWSRDREAKSSLLFSFATLAAAIVIFLELVLINTQTLEEYNELLTWQHVALAVLLIALAWFIDRLLETGRTWLAWFITATNLLVIVVSFVTYPNLMFQKITSLRQVGFLGETFSIPQGEANSWRWLVLFSVLLLLVYIVDATISAWKRDRRQRALLVGGAASIAIAGMLISANLMSLGIFPIYFAGANFLVIVLAMLFEQSVNLARSRTLGEDLREIEKRMSLAASAAELGMWEWDIVRDQIWLNNARKARLGVDSIEYMTLENYMQFIHPDDRESVSSTIQQAIEGNGEIETQLRLVSQDGDTRWVAVHGQVRRDRQGRAVSTAGVTLDITKLHEREEALQESEERFRNVSNTAPVMIWMSGTDKLCNFFNKGWLDYTGRTLEQELGNGWAEGVHPDDFKQCLDTYTASFDAHHEFTMQYRLRKHDGEYGWVTDTGVPRFNGDGEFLGYIGTCVDITYQKEIEVRIRESAEFNDKVLASLYTQIAIIEKNGTILAVNDAWVSFARTNGKFPSDVGSNYLDECDRVANSGDMNARRAVTGIKSVLEGEIKLFEMEYPCHSPGEFRTLLMRVVPLQTAAGGGVISLTDVSQLKLAERESAELRRELAHVQRTSTLGQLSSALAHEINQPLGAILRNIEAAELYLKKTPPDLEELQEIFLDIRSDEQRAAQVIERMRSLIMRRELKFEAISVKELFGQIEMLMRSELQAQEATLFTDVPSKLPEVSGDRIHIQQVILNLILNSLDAMGSLPTGEKRIVIRAAQTDDHMVKIALSDRGPGFKPELISSVFKPFYTTKSKGMGIGLAISKTIVGMHGGKISAENNPDGGATVWFTLKLADQED